jgi:alkylation response protein AidB-like acyl-CoA dehydrogenase
VTQTETLTDNDNSDVIAMLRDSAANFCAHTLDRSRLRALRGTSPAFDRDAWQQMADLGWTAMVVPEDLEGLDLGAAAAVAVCRELGGVVAPEPLIETAVGAATLLTNLGAHGKLLQSLIGGKKIVIPVIGALNSDPFGAVEANELVGKYVLKGALTNVPLGPDADVWLVPARLEGQPAWFHVSPKFAGITCEPIWLADGTCDAHIVLDGCNGELLGAGESAQNALDLTRIHTELSSSAYLLGLSEALFQITLDYVGTRRQFGQAIGSFQVIQHRLVDLYMQIRLTDAVVAEGCASIDRGAMVAGLRAASRARYRACQTALTVTREAIQLHGAIGTTEECDVGLYVNRALVLVARYGQPSAHAERIARLRSEASVVAPEAMSGIDGYAEPPEGDWTNFNNDEFRGVVRHWFENNYPGELRNPRARLRWHECRDWYQVLYRRGWAAPAWPAEHGGMGLSPEKFLIFIEEQERLGVARTPDQGIIMVGPLLMQHGTPEQQKYYLPPALSGAQIWCQGYSEPNAGSDLASLRTSAVRDGDRFVINGQKIWTTMAQDATHMFCLVRTDSEAKPQAGISFVLIDLAVPGITIRPIRNIAGDEEFCEVFFDDVRVPVDSLVGGLNDGWRIAKALLSFERIFIGSPKQCQHGLSRLHELASAMNLWDDPVFVDRLTRFELDVADLESLYKEFADVIRRGETLGPDVSLLKIWASETVVRLSEFMLEAAAESGARVGAVDFAGTSVDILTHYYNARPTPIYGGSNEIQRNILAKHVLKLPSK